MEAHQTHICIDIGILTIETFYLKRFRSNVYVNLPFLIMASNYALVHSTAKDKSFQSWRFYKKQNQME